MISTTEAKAEIFWTAFTSLRKKEKEAVLERFFKEKDFIEDFIDSAIIKQRMNEPVRRLEDYLKDRKVKTAKK